DVRERDLGCPWDQTISLFVSSRLASLEESSIRGKEVGERLSRQEKKGKKTERRRKRSTKYGTDDDIMG
ncbi:1610_t:CDS:1, partial [Acaulospora colombiana]